jgi:hypothetical protein
MVGGSIGRTRVKTTKCLLQLDLEFSPPNKGWRPSTRRLCHSLYTGDSTAPSARRSSTATFYIAGHNMVRIAQNYLIHQKRPLYLRPVDQNGNYPSEASTSSNAQARTSGRAQTSSSIKAGSTRKKPG